MKSLTPLSRLFALSLAFAALPLAHAAEESLASPDGRIAIVVSDAGGLHYRVALYDEPTLAASRLGLDFSGSVSLGRATLIRPLIESGLLVALFPERMKARYAHYLVYPNRSLDHPGFNAFRTWILAEAAAFRDAETRAERNAERGRRNMRRKT